MDDGSYRPKSWVKDQQRRREDEKKMGREAYLDHVHERTLAARAESAHPLSKKFRDIARKNEQELWKLGPVLRRVAVLLDEWWQESCADAKGAYERMSELEQTEFRKWLTADADEGVE